MTSLSYRGHRFPASIIQHAIWLYVRFTLSYRDVEELLAERELELSYETTRRWVLKFEPVVARRQRQPRSGDRWHLDEMAVRIASRGMYLRPAVDQRGEILDMLVQSRRDKRDVTMPSQPPPGLWPTNGVWRCQSGLKGRSWVKSRWVSDERRVKDGAPWWASPYW